MDLGAAQIPVLRRLLGLLAAAVCFVWQYRQTRNRKPMACFNAFLHNHWAGLAIFIGIVADYALS